MSMKIGFIAAAMALASLLAVRDSAAVPACDDVEYSEQQIDGAMDRAMDKLAKRGVVVTDLNSPSASALFKEISVELGCRLEPGGDLSAFGARRKAK